MYFFNNNFQYYFFTACKNYMLLIYNISINNFFLTSNFMDIICVLIKLFLLISLEVCFEDRVYNTFNNLKLE